MVYNYENIEKALDKIANGEHTYVDGKLISKRTGKPVGYVVGKGNYLGYEICGKNVRVHRVIFALHHGIDELKKHEVIDHIDGDKHNNRIENLRGMSSVGNVLQHFERIQHGGVKLSFDDVREIRRELALGVPYKDLAARYNVSVSTISNISTRATFKYLK